MHSLRNESDFDLIVVGAGPSGSMAALSAQRRGTNTLLLEREEEVGSNVICGEAVSSSIFKDFVPFDQRWVSSRITSASLGVEGRGEFTVHLAEAAWVLKRRVFDRDLSHMAERAGVTLVTGAAATGPIMEGTRLVGVKVEFGGEERHYFAPVVIGADGIASIVGRWAGMDTALGVGEIVSCAQWLVLSREIPHNRVEFAIGTDLAPGGYAWVFPKGEGRANVGVGVSPAISHKRAVDCLEDFVSKRFRSARVLERKSGGVSTSFRGEVARTNILLCGDAARVGDPLTGGGIYNAMATGMWAGEAASRAGGLMIADLYRRKVIGQLGRELKLMQHVRRIWLGLNTAQFRDIWEFGRNRFSNRIISDVYPLRVIASFLLTHPAYLKYLPGLVGTAFQMSNTI